MTLTEDQAYRIVERKIEEDMAELRRSIEENRETERRADAAWEFNRRLQKALEALEGRMSE